MGAALLVSGLMAVGTVIIHMSPYHIIVTWLPIFYLLCLTLPSFRGGVGSVV